MNTNVDITMSFDPNLLAAMATAAPRHLASVQRALLPYIFARFVKIGSNVRDNGQNKEIRQFQDAMRNLAISNEHAVRFVPTQMSDDWTEPFETFVDSVKSVCFCYVHLFAASDSVIGPHFSTPQLQPTFRLTSNISPNRLIVYVVKRCAELLYDNPFLIMHEKEPRKFVENRVVCLKEMEKIVDAILTERCRLVVKRLVQEFKQRSTPLPARIPIRHRDIPTKQVTTKSSQSAMFEKSEEHITSVSVPRVAPVFDKTISKSESEQVKRIPLPVPRSRASSSSTSSSSSSSAQPSDAQSEIIHREPVPTIELANSS